MAFSLHSEAFTSGGPIPATFGCDGEGISPPLSWEGAPQGTAAFVLVVDDPDAPSGDFIHWVLYNLPANTSSLPPDVPPEERLPDGALQGRNDYGKVGYGPLCPPHRSTHHYRFQLYALDQQLGLPPGAALHRVEDAMRGHSRGKAELVGTYGRS